MRQPSQIGLCEGTGPQIQRGHGQGGIQKAPVPNPLAPAQTADLFLVDVKDIFQG